MMKRLLKLAIISYAAALLRETSKQRHAVLSFSLHNNPSYVRTHTSYYIDSSPRIDSSSLYAKSTWSNNDRSKRHKTPSNRYELTTQSRELLQSYERIGKQQQQCTSLEKQTKLFHQQIEILLEHDDLTQLIIPRDASSLIRLLGRNRIYDAMLQFCRRYCRDMINASLVSDELKQNYTMEEANEAILYCYTAAISACSKPVPYLDLSSAQSGMHRNKTFLLSLIDEMEQGYSDDSFRIRPNSYTLSAVLLGIDDESEALEVLQQFEEKYGETESAAENIVTVQVYNAAISACARSSFVKNEEKTNRVQGWQVGLSLYNKMKRNGPAPNDQTVLAVLQALAGYGQLRVAMSIFDEMKETSTVELKSKLYKPLLKTCATAEKAQAAENMIQQMRDDGIKITTEHMNLLLLALAKCKMHTRALEVLQEMIELQEIEQSEAPDIVTFNTVLSACANADEYEAARILLDDMREGIYLVPDDTTNSLVEVRPDVISYNTVISCADPVSALELINEMRLTRRNRVGVISPNSVSYTNAIARCRKASTSSDLDDRRYAFDIAFTLFELAKESALDATVPRVDLNVYLYSSLIWVAESVGNYKAAVQLLRSMECSPNTVCYDGVISALSKRGLHREALYFYYEMQKLGLHRTRNIYSKLAFAINNARDSEVFASPRKKAALLEGVLSQMSDRDRAVSIGGPLFELLIRCHGNKAEPGSSHVTARSVFDQIKGPVDNACLSVMVRVYSSVSMWEEAIMLLHCSDIVKEATGPGRISTRALSYAVIACAKANQFDEAFNIIELYRDDSCDHGATSEVVTVAALNSLIGACGRAQRPDLAVEILNNMQKKYRVTPNVKSYRTAIIACNQAEHREAKDMKRCDELVPFEFTWWECALSLLRRMIEDGLKPDSQTYSSVVSALESAGQWQRALGVLQTMPSIAPLMGNSLPLDVMSSALDDVEVFEPPNLYVLNAAISACEKGGAWVEALTIYENIRAQEHTENATKPNFITVNSLMIALDKAGQIELAMSIYDEAVRDKIVNPMKRRKDNDGTIQRMMDLHKFSAPMARIAMNSYLNSFLRSRKEPHIMSDAVIIVGKGKGSEGEPVLMPTVMKLLEEEYSLAPEIDPKNGGRIRIPKKSIEDLVKTRRWKL